MTKQKQPSMDVLRRQLRDAVEACDELGLEYHLEGGTLLGIVRDGDILPWDHDTDVSIMREDVRRIPELIEKLKSRGWRASERAYQWDKSYARTGETRLVKVKGRRFFFFPDQHMLDVFVKTRSGGHVYWQAVGETMRVPESHYDGYDTVEWQGLKVKTPVDYDTYLTLKYGDWRTPVKEWNASMEKTIIEDKI